MKNEIKAQCKIVNTPTHYSIFMWRNYKWHDRALVWLRHVWAAMKMVPAKADVDTLIVERTHEHGHPHNFDQWLQLNTQTLLNPKNDK